MSLDTIARGQAAQALAGRGRQQRFAALYQSAHRHLVEAKTLNPHANAAMASPPTVTSTTTQPTIARLPANATTSSDYAPYVACAGGWPRVANGAIYCKSATSVIGAATGGDSDVAIGGSARLILFTDDPSPTFGIQMDNVLPFRVIVDGQYVSLTGHTPASTTLAFWTFAFGASKPRRIEIELQSGQKLRYLYRSSLLYSFWAPATLGLRHIIQGDSYTLGPVTGQVPIAMLGDGLARVAGDYLGMADTWASGIGGTGYLWRSSSTAAANALDRASDVTAWSPDILSLLLGVNDLSNDGAMVGGGVVSAAAVQARVATLLAKYRAALPNVPICVFGPWRFASTVATTATTYEAAIAAAVSAANDRLIAFQPVIAPAWLTGTGGSASSGTYAPKGDGNGDVYYGPYDYHPSIAGHAYLGRRVAQGVTACLETMRARMG